MRLVDARSRDGVKVKLEVNEEGRVTYSVGKRKTTFNVVDCSELVKYHFKGNRGPDNPGGFDEEVTLTVDDIADDMGSGAGVCTVNKLEPWVWLAIVYGENRLEYNNNQRESRRHCSHSDFNDKIDTLRCEEDVLRRVLKEENKDMLWAAIDSLTPKQRELVTAVYFRGLTQAEFARCNGVNRSSVSKQMKRALKQLKRHLVKAGVGGPRLGARG